jgi:Raf kinase inhibitor-like YbhB/YbcL family protein
MPARTAGIGVGENVSPPLEWTGVPRDAAELLLVIEDPDAPLRRPVIHLALAGIPPSLTGFDEGDLTTGGRFGRGTGSRGHQGYAGPRPIPGHGPHRYVFQLYALATPLNVPGNAGARAIVAAADGKVLSRGRLTGLYER